MEIAKGISSRSRVETLYQIWADMVTFGKRIVSEPEQEYFCAYASRKDGKRYAHTHEEILEKYGSVIIAKQALSYSNPCAVFRSAPVGSYVVPRTTRPAEHITFFANPSTTVLIFQCYCFMNTAPNWQPFLDHIIR